jgi:PPOX class probable F420-dependent enzyme
MQIDMSTPFGQRVAQRLDQDVVIWLTTVRVDGTPEPSPVWFLWDGETFLIYSLRNTSRETNIRGNPRVSLNFDSRNGGDVVIFTGEAEVVDDVPPVHANQRYMDKYRDRIGRFSTPENFAKRYSLPIRVRATKLRGH